MKYDYHIIIIGAGSAGLVVASGAASLGAKVALIESSKMGGDCLNTGCVPSKSFLKSAHLSRDINLASNYGIEIKDKSINMKKIMDRVHSVIKSIQPHDSKERFESLGVDVYEGIGSFVDSHTISISNKNKLKKKITGKNIVIATGSVPKIPNIKGLEDISFYTNENIFNLETLPNHLIVLGSGPIGLELGQGFKNLGSNVTIINRSDRLFKNDEPEVGMLMKNIFQNEGIIFQKTSKLLEVKKDSKNNILLAIEIDGEKKIISGDGLLISLGRSPSLKTLGLDKINISLDKNGYIRTDNKLRTNYKHIFACGDITGPFRFTHMAGYQAGLVMQNAIFHLNKKVNYSVVPWTTYTNPEVAHVGYTKETAILAGIYGKSFSSNLANNDRAMAEGNTEGFLKIIVNKKNQVIGGTMVGNKAGEQIALTTLAIENKMKLEKFLNIIFSYPTEVEIYKSLALISLKENFKPWQKNLIKKIFLR